jgi:hypothetical protein
VLSPRLMGEVAYGAGRVAGGLNSLPLRPIGQGAFQMGPIHLETYGLKRGA